MKEFIIKTNFGHTYRWSSEQISQDYAATAIQFQDDEDIQEPKTQEELFKYAMTNSSLLESWYNDHIRDDHTYAYEQAELVNVDVEAFEDFIKTAIYNFGDVIST